MQRLLKWSSISILLLTAACITSCTTMTEEERENAARKAETNRIAKELGRGKTEKQEKKTVKRKTVKRKTVKRKKKKKAEQEAPIQQLCELTVKADKEEYTVGEPIKVTITYKNLDEERIRLVADGETADAGFSGEMFIIKRRNFKDSYSFLPKNLKTQEHVVYPNEQWSHTVGDVEAVLQQDAVKGHREPETDAVSMQTDREKALAVLDLPRFQKPDSYTFQVIYYPNRMKPTMTMKEKEMLGKNAEADNQGRTYAGPRIIDDKLESNVLRITVNRKD